MCSSDLWSYPESMRVRGTDFTALMASVEHREIDHPDSPRQPLRTPGRRRREFMRGDGGHVEVHVQLLEDGSTVAVHEDVTVKRANEARIRYLANHDCLTGLPNRGSLNRELERLLLEGTPSGTAVLYLDLDRFKPVNDTLGHAAGDLLLVSSLGLSPSGQVFNCQSESVAAATAAQLSADKLIYLTAGEAVVDVRNGSMVQNLPLSSAVDFLAVHSAGTATASESDPSEAAAAPVDDLPDVFRLCLTESVGALKAGVRRAHLLNRFIDGVLLMEIFHRDGVGFMISRDLYEGIRAARMDDVAGIVEVIRPLEEAGILVPRSRASLEGAIGDFTVVERDGMIIACVSLTIAADEPQAAELGCFAVRPEYRKLGKGDALLGFIERKSYALGVRRLFILSTQSFHWFLERGFEEISVERVPESKRVKVDRSRKSKVYQKLLLGGRAVDEQELLKHL